MCYYVVLYYPRCWPGFRMCATDNIGAVADMPVEHIKSQNPRPMAGGEYHSTTTATFGPVFKFQIPCPNILNIGPYLKNGYPYGEHMLNFDPLE